MQGVILYQCLTKNPPFRAQSIKALYKLIIDTRAVFPTPKVLCCIELYSTLHSAPAALYFIQKPHIWQHCRRASMLSPLILFYANSLSGHQQRVYGLTPIPHANILNGSSDVCHHVFTSIPHTRPGHAYSAVVNNRCVLTYYTSSYIIWC